MSDESGQPSVVDPAAGAPTPPPAGSAPPGYGPPAPPPPASSHSQPHRTRPPLRAIGGIIGVLVVVGVKLFAFASITHLLHGASPVVIIIVLIAVAILLRRVFRFLGR